MNLGHTDHVEVTVDDLIIEHFDPPVVPPKTSAAMKGDPALRRLAKKRRIPHPTSLAGILMIGGLLVGAGVYLLRRAFA